MAEEQKLYSVIELAEEVGVPRTTINDWLSKYTQYIEFTMQGRRRVYSLNTLSVLHRISELRNSGKTSFEIERELAASFAVHPEPEPESADKAVPPIPGEGTAAAEKVPAAGETAEAAATAIPESPASAGATVLPEGAYALIAKENSDAVMRAVGDRFQAMLDQMAILEKDAKRNTVRMWFFCIFALLLFVLLGAGALLAWQYSQNMERSSAEKEKALQVLSNQTNGLHQYSLSLQSDVRKLQEGLAEQRKEFDRAMAEAKENYEKRREAELALEKEKFTSEKLQYLRDMEQMNRDREKEHEAQVESMTRQLAERDAELVTVRSELKKQSEQQKQDKPGTKSKENVGTDTKAAEKSALKAEKEEAKSLPDTKTPAK